MCRIGKVLDAMDSPENYGDMKWRHISGLIVNGKLVAVGSCNHRTRVGDCNMPSIHAEMHALMLFVGSHNIKNLLYTSNKNKKRYNCSNNKNKKYNKKLYQLRNAEMVVVRKPNSENINHYLESRPCNECIKLLKQLGIKKVHYSDEKGEIITEKVKDMEFRHDTPGNVRYKKKLLK